MDSMEQLPDFLCRVEPIVTPHFLASIVELLHWLRRMLDTKCRYNNINNGYQKD